MAAEYGVSILIKAIDNATAPMSKLQKQIRQLFLPVAKLQRSLKNLGKASGMDKLAKSIKGLHAPLKKSWEEAGKLVAKLGLLGGGLLGGAIAGFKALFLNVATQNETLARSMANVTGSADAAKAALAGIQASLRGWDTEDAANAFMRLKQSGLGTSEEDLKKLADMAGHTGKSLTDVASALASLKDGSTGGLEELLGGNIKKIGNYIVAEFSDAEGKLRRMAVKQTGSALKDARALQQLLNKSVDAKGMAGGAERFGQSWQGMVQRAQSAWRRFVTLIMDSGPFNALKAKFQSILAKFEELEASGGLQALAEEWAKKLTDAIEYLWGRAQELVTWFQEDFLPAFQEVKEFMGGWGGILKAVAAVMAGPLVLALAAATKAVIALGAAILATPVGWIMAAVAAVAAVVYVIYKNWSKIIGWLKGAWNALVGWLKGKIDNILGAFDKGFLQGMFAIFKEFSPVAWIAKALDALGQKLFGFSLIEAGKNIVNSLLDGLKEKWEAVKSWLSNAWESLTGWLPDGVRSRLGIDVDMPKPEAPKPAGGPPTGAAGIMTGGAAAAPGRLPEQKVRTEVVITGENLPPGISVSTPKSQADKTRLDCGYMMPGVG